MSRRSVTKGKRWEREVAQRLRDAMPGCEVRRGDQRSGAREADVEVPVWWIECKVGAMPNPRAALRQAMEDAPPGRVPVAVVKDDRGQPFVCLTLDDWLDFVGEWWERR